MSVNEFMTQFIERYPDIDRFDCATDKMIAKYEEILGYRLPVSFMAFLKEFSNGIFLLDCEPIGGVSKDSPCGDICKVNRIIEDIPNELLIVETNERIESNRLLSFTTFDAGNISNNHWVFLCEDGVPNNEYRVGLVSQSSHKIVKVLDNLEEWLTIFWEQDDEDEMTYPVFHVLYPSYEERGEILYDWWLD
ncbi:SMI1/KNR4 family protein [Psychrobacillus sp. L4]|uniref:SMI1/KNR4 family protein n=1 Tax=Psychrobacillus sp. L4 TaxID=3236892 RepID=UPI0036F2E1F8